jgi:hypothetical protein
MRNTSGTKPLPCYLGSTGLCSVRRCHRSFGPHDEQPVRGRLARLSAVSQGVRSRAILADLAHAGLKSATNANRLAVISLAHRAAGPGARNGGMLAGGPVERLRRIIGGHPHRPLNARTDVTLLVYGAGFARAIDGVLLRSPTAITCRSSSTRRRPNRLAFSVFSVGSGHDATADNRNRLTVPYRTGERAIDVVEREFM